MAEFNLYPAALTPGHPSESDGETTRVLGTVFWSDLDTYVMALTWWAPTTLPGFCDMGYWSLTSDNPAANTGTRIDLLSPSVGSMTANAWNRFNLPTPRALPNNVPRLTQVHTDGHYTFSNPDTFQMNSDDGTLHAYDEATGGNGRWFNGGGNNDVATNQHPGGSGYNFFVGVITDVMAGVTPEVFTFGTPDTPDQTDSGQIYTLGRVFRSSSSGVVKGVRWRAPTNPPATRCRMVLYEVGNTTALAQSNLFTARTGVDNDVIFTSEYAIAANTDYIACVVTDRYAFTSGGWPFTSSPGGFLTASAGSGATANGRLGFTGTPGSEGVATYPGTASGSSADFFISPLFVADGVVSGTINEVTESGTVFPISKKKIYNLNFATETGVVQPISKAKSRIIGQVTESGLVLPVHVVRSRTVGQVTGSGTVFPISAAKSKAIGEVLESGTVQQVSSGTAISKAIGQVIELSAVGRLGPKPEVDTEIVIPANRTIIKI